MAECRHIGTGVMEGSVGYGVVRTGCLACPMAINRCLSIANSTGCSGPALATDDHVDLMRRIGRHRPTRRQPGPRPTADAGAAGTGRASGNHLPDALFSRSAAVAHCEVVRLKMRFAQHLIVFTRKPRLGAGKRRLARDIGPVAALRFQYVMLSLMLRRLGRDRRWTTWLAVTPDRSGPWLASAVPDAAAE
jgi:hypothetical protein